MPVDGNIGVSFTFNDRRVNLGLPSSATNGVNIQSNRQIPFVFTDGVGALQGDRLFSGKRTLSGTTDNLDLAGVLADAYGGTLTLARVKVLYVYNSGLNDIVVGAGTNPWVGLLNSTGTFTLPPGGLAVFVNPTAAGWTVTAATGDILKITGTSGQTYEILALGAST
jgi:hypothetical protein